MSESPPRSPAFSLHHNVPTLNHRFILGLWALFSLGLGLFSLLSLLGQSWWVCGGIGLLGCTLIMIRLNRRQSPGGVLMLGAAGLCLSLGTISYVPTHFFLRQDALCQQAALFGNEWLESILAGKPYLAIVAMQDPETRLAKDQMQAFYSKNVEGRREYMQFNRNRLIRSLTDLDGRARSQFYQTENIRVQGGAETISSLFAISYLETPLKRKTFFVRLVLKHNSRGEGQGQWTVLRYRGGVRPRSGRYSQSTAAIGDTVR